MSDKPAVLAVGAHPDDIEFMMAGTLLLLGKAGWALHYMNVGNGSCGTATQPREAIITARREEAKEACRLAGAEWHPALVNDIEIVYSPEMARKVGAVVRKVCPRIMLIPSPQDYMEDHVNAGRLAVTAAFTRTMLNFPSDPPVRPVNDPVTLYHALPYGLRGPLRERIRPGQFVDVSSVMKERSAMLACHRSQKDWLDKSQGVGSYVAAMEGFTGEVGKMSGRFAFAEGWRRRSHLGFCGPADDPLAETLGDKCFVDPAYEAGLEKA